MKTHRSQYPRPRILRPELIIHPPKYARCLVLGKPAKALMRWLRHEYLPKRIMRQWDSRFTLSRRELDWLYAHGFLLYADIIGMVRSHKDRNYLSQIVFPYRKNAWYYDQEVIALQNLLLTRTVTVYLAHSAIEHHDTSPLRIPLYNTFKPLSTNDYITQIRTKHGPPDRTRKEKP